MEQSNEEQVIDVTSAEHKVIGIILNNPNYLYDLQRQLSFEMFSVESLKIIYKRMVSLFDEQFLPDLDMIRNSLNSAGLLDAVGGEAFLNYLKKLPTEVDYKNVEKYVDIINKAFKSREILKIGKYARRLEENIDVVDTVISDIRERVDYIDTKGFKSNADRISAFLPQTFLNYKEKVNSPGLIGKSTGYQNIDSITGGFRGGNLWVLGGRPSHGKTAFVLNSMLRAAEMGTKSIIFSLEMNEQQIVERLCSLISHVDHTKIMLGIVNKEEDERVEKAFEHLKTLPIWISTIYNLDSSEITKAIKEQNARNGIEVFWIDYVQLTADRDTEAVHALGRISRACKLLAKELNVFVGLVSQLNRNVEMREDKRPNKADLRQSGNLEEDADLVAFIYRDEVYNKNRDDNKGQMEFIIDKHRNGAIGMLPMLFTKETMRIEDGGMGHGEQTEEKGNRLGAKVSKVDELEFKRS